MTVPIWRLGAIVRHTFSMSNQARSFGNSALALTHSSICRTFALEHDPSAGDMYIRSVVFSPNSKILAAGAEDKSVKVRCDLPDRLLYNLPTNISIIKLTSIPPAYLIDSYGMYKTNV